MALLTTAAPAGAVRTSPGVYSSGGNTYQPKGGVIPRAPVKPVAQKLGATPAASGGVSSGTGSIPNAIQNLGLGGLPAPATSPSTMNPADPPTGPWTMNPPDAAPVAPPVTPTPAPGPQSKLPGLFPNANDSPDSWQDSPYYTWQIQHGEHALDAYLAAKGLSGSGAQVQGVQDLIAQTGATAANQIAQLKEVEAQRQADVQQNQWQDTNTEQQQKVTNSLALLNQLLGQSPLTTDATMTGNSAALTDKQGAAIQAILSQLYNHVSAPASSGGQAIPGYNPPVPPEDNSASTLAGNLASNSGSNSVINGILAALPGLIG